MNVTHINQVLSPEDAHLYFALEGSRLYRKLAAGGASQLRSMDGVRVVTIFKGTRLVGTDIAWCLIYGNWPLFPIVQLGSDPLDFSQDNLIPARIKRLNYVQRQSGTLFFHPLSQFGHSSAERCRAHWEDLAREFYGKDLMYVLKQEALQREMRAKYLAETRAISPTSPILPKKERPQKTTRPAPVKGMEWHWYEGEWISVPVACHVADDYRVRIKAWLGGARSFKFDADSRTVKAYYPDGRLYQ